MFLRKIVVGEFEVNCYIIAEEEKGKGLIIDPGGNSQAILDVVKKNKLEILYIIATHAHIDHIADIETVRDFTGAQFLLHPLDVPFLKDPDLNLSSLIQTPRVFSPPEKLVEDGERLKVGKIELEVLHTPGHTPGSISLKMDRCIFTGDTLFCRGVGRVDLPGGDWQALQKSIREKIFPLPDDIKVFPGHGPESIIEKERRENPFFK
ncbi:MBL fold metallo-hydrolase [Candidatus Aerophobetes bacterium]|uniref:MBL fold metallo-hydrolase n=1 Tax=Aerophobetes bacterium TaxID=2030807 RepID=A0A662DCW1_UNCAE|nr:MAG: MBL fold metallo-hydrolase [Candidatus Aerophobetes bacterium]